MPLFLSLLLQLLPSLKLSLPLDILLLLLLHFHDPVVHLHEEVRELGIDLVDHVTEVSGSFIVDALEEHDSLEVLREVLHLGLWQLPLEDLNDILLVGILDLLSQVDDLLLDVDESLHIAPHLRDPQRVNAHDLPTDSLDLDVALVRDFVYKVSNGQLGTLRQDVKDVLALHEARGLYRTHNRLL